MFTYHSTQAPTLLTTFSSSAETYQTGGFSGSGVVLYFTPGTVSAWGSHSFTTREECTFSLYGVAETYGGYLTPRTIVAYSNRWTYYQNATSQSFQTVPLGGTASGGDGYFNLETGLAVAALDYFSNVWADTGASYSTYFQKTTSYNFTSTWTSTTATANWPTTTTTSSSYAFPTTSAFGTLLSTGNTSSTSSYLTSTLATTSLSSTAYKTSTLSTIGLLLFDTVVEAFSTDWLWRITNTSSRDRASLVASSFTKNTFSADFSASSRLFSAPTYNDESYDLEFGYYPKQTVTYIYIEPDYTESTSTTIATTEASITAVSAEAGSTVLVPYAGTVEQTYSVTTTTTTDIYFNVLVSYTESEEFVDLPGAYSSVTNIVTYETTTTDGVVTSSTSWTSPVNAIDTVLQRYTDSYATATGGFDTYLSQSWAQAGYQHNVTNQFAGGTFFIGNVFAKGCAIFGNADYFLPSAKRPIVLFGVQLPPIIGRGESQGTAISVVGPSFPMRQQAYGYASEGLGTGIVTPVLWTETETYEYGLGTWTSFYSPSDSKIHLTNSDGGTTTVSLQLLGSVRADLTETLRNLRWGGHDWLSNTLSLTATDVQARATRQNSAGATSSEYLTFTPASSTVTVQAADGIALEYVPQLSAYTTNYSAFLSFGKFTAFPSTAPS